MAGQLMLWLHSTLDIQLTTKFNRSGDVLGAQSLLDSPFVYNKFCPKFCPKFAQMTPPLQECTNSKRRAKIKTGLKLK